MKKKVMKTPNMIDQTIIPNQTTISHVDLGISRVEMILLKNHCWDSSPAYLYLWSASRGIKLTLLCYDKESIK
jgi:hypothetical protein